MKFYEYHGYCTARVEEQRKCRNFAECKAGQGICKYSLLGGSCDWEPDTMDMIVDIYDCKGEKGGNADKNYKTWDEPNDL